MSSIQKFFPQGEFTPVGCDEALDGAVMALKVLATGRSTGLNQKDCQALYEQLWQITHCALNDKADRESLESTKLELGVRSQNYKGDSTNLEKRLPVYAEALKVKVKRMFGLDFEKISAKGKKMDKVRIRAIIINATLHSGIGNLSQLARLLQRDHTCIIHSRNNLHQEFMLTDKDYKRDYQDLCRWWNAIKIEEVGGKEK